MASVHIKAEKIGKRYTLRHSDAGARYTALRDVLATKLRNLLHRPLRQLQASSEEEFWALQDISFEVNQGQVLGIIGRNGAGKSTLAKILSRITEPTSGRVTLHGRVASLLEVGTGFHPELTGRENIYLNGAILGMSRSEIRAKFDEIVSFAEVEPFLDTQVKHYSSGMAVRLAFAVAAHLQPEILIVDEVLAVGDAAFQKKCLGKMESVSKEGRTVLFISHSMSLITRICDRAIALEKGKIANDGTAHEVARTYLAASGTGSSSSWRPSAPVGDSAAKVHSARLHSPDGNCASTFSIGCPIYCTVEYELLAGGQRAMPALQLVNESGTVVFGSAAFQLRETTRIGCHSATCTIPAHLLAEGHHSLNIAVVSYNPNTLHAFEREVLSMLLVDDTSGDGARGDATGHWPGIVRPKLDWAVAC
ncbi:ABC transporter ATP-binding protein [Verrucomicrobium sp. BvORR034]|uniref:ABC transporter ATP-binding protein n=1 Tax=Verrucomicrobium sp. BvORR034 TaxID=1396418 RepID=UPI0006787DAB|nr:ABC transporter ATP-binding protein [Verrucomicrobium sp. BvORR034]